MQSAVALALALLAFSVGHTFLAHDSALADITSLQCEGHGMRYPMLLQQENEIFPALPRNLLIVFLVLSFMIPISKYVFRLIKAQVQLFLAAANQDEEDFELNE